MRGNPPGHLVLQALKNLAQNVDHWYTAETLTGGLDRSPASLANSCAAGVRHGWVKRRQVGKMPYYQITGPAWWRCGWPLARSATTAATWSALCMGGCARIWLRYGWPAVRARMTLSPGLAMRLA